MKRSFLTALGLEKDIIDQIMAEHGNTVEVVKEKTREDAEKQAEKLSKKIDELQGELDAAPTGDGVDWKQKYEDEVKAHGETKSSYEQKETLSTKRALAKKALLDSGVKEDILEDFMLSALDYEGVEIEKGAIKAADKFVESVKGKYGKYFGEVQTVGAQVANPPVNGGGVQNPWRRGEHYSLQRQTEIYRKDPTLARQLAAEAGVKL